MLGGMDIKLDGMTDIKQAQHVVAASAQVQLPTTTTKSSAAQSISGGMAIMPTSIMRPMGAAAVRNDTTIFCTCQHLFLQHTNEGCNVHGCDCKKKIGVGS